MSSAVPDRNLALDLVRVTESAATFAARWIGRGDKNAADQAAVDAMRLLFNSVPFDSTKVVAAPVGTASLSFTDGANGSFEYTVNGVTQTKSITRQIFAAPGTVCQ